ncbi:hypothetical protein FC72_GL001939 [Companilactobacillus tucceti DSM 20183]|uniref:Uncharacterized protein n=1 Tax=Companilactobacillus tucceti DSM 20183 TaxID=1423811 RepID=A0A0R1J0V3_9LACO|nr:hypothetical protein [Companilactobacillus tucceti]KRK64699.1 hypothetical protein FC72_GL001939 [Companilactobacillus tucceti DSM 20183]
MGKTIARGQLLETNVFVERFLTYREVFVEYFKTMNLIERGEALTHENYSRLTYNYVINVKRFSQLCNSYITKYHLESSKLDQTLNSYFIELINGLDCMDQKHNVLNRELSIEAQQKIKNCESKFMETIGKYIG